MSEIRVKPLLDLSNLAENDKVALSPSDVVTPSMESSDLGETKVSPLSAALSKETPSALVSMGAALHSTLASRMLQAADFNSIPSEDGFDFRTALGTRIQEFNPDELASLTDARSSTELNRRIEALRQTRMDYELMGAHPVAALGASLVDVDLAIGGGLGLMSKASRLTRMATSAAAMGTALGIASKGGVVTPTEAAMWSIGAIAMAAPSIRRAGTVVEDTLPNEAAPVRNAAAEATPLADNVDNIKPAVVDEYVPDPEYPVKPTTEARVPQEATHYFTDENGVTLVRTKAGNMETAIDPIPENAVRVKSFGELLEPTNSVKVGTEIKALTDNFELRPVAAVSDVVAKIMEVRKDLSPFVRYLGGMLSKALKSEDIVPLRFESKIQGVSNSVTGAFNFTLNKRISDIIIKANTNGAKNLDELVRRLPKETVHTILHEAMHSKVASTIKMVEMGRKVPAHLSKAVKQLQDVFAYIKTTTAASTLKSNGELRYAMSNVHEFVSQLFNSPDLVRLLKATPYAETKQTVFTRVKHAIASIISGKKGTAMNTVAEAIDTLFQEASVWAKPTPERLLRDIKDSAVSSLLKDTNWKDIPSKVAKAIDTSLSTFEYIAAGGPKIKNLASKLFVDSTSTEATSATHYTRAALLTATVPHMRLQNIIQQELVRSKWNIINRWFHPTEYKTAQRAFVADLYDAIQDNYIKFRDGIDITPHTNASIQRCLQELSDSNWANDMLDMAKRSGIEGIEDIKNNPWYMPREHNYDKVVNYIKEHPSVTMKDIENMYASQFKRMFFEKGITDETANRLGKEMVKHMQQRSVGAVDWRKTIPGMREDTIRDIMESVGIEDAKINDFLDTTHAMGTEARVSKNLRHRADFNMTEEYITKSGEIITPNMFVNKSIPNLMEHYNRRMAGRIGLAKAGIPSLHHLDSLVADAMSEVSDNAGRIQETLDNGIKSLLGMPTGERVPDIFRSLSTVSSAMSLRSQGIYQLGDYVLMMQEYGIRRTLKYMASNAIGRNALAVARSPEYGKRLQDVLEGNLTISGMYRPLITHLEDNFDIGHMGEMHQFIQHLGQSTRFITGLEAVRRWQVRTFANMIGDTLEQAIKGDKGAIKILARNGLSDDLLNRIRAARVISEDASTWDKGLLLDTQSMLTNAADTVILENRLGELSPWIQFSALGKVVFQWLSFVSGAWNKLFKRTLALDGKTGVAMAMLYQLPVNVLTSIAAMVNSGKDISNPKDVAIRALTQVPIMSWFGYALQMAYNGPTANLAALSALDRMHKAAASMTSSNPDPAKLVDAMPWISLIPGFRAAASSMGDDNKKPKENHNKSN